MAVSKQTISQDGSPPYGDSTNGLLQDNAYSLKWDEVGPDDKGHSQGNKSISPVPAPDPPGGQRLKPPEAPADRATTGTLKGALKEVLD